MTDKPASGSRRTIASFDSDDEIPPPTAQQLAEARSAGEGLGFRSEKAAPASRPAPRAREPNFTDAIHVRARPQDRERFEDFAWRHRLKKGTAMTLLLDLAEAEERRRAEAGD